MNHSPELISLLGEDAWARRLAEALTSDRGAADDLVQEAYARVLARTVAGRSAGDGGAAGGGQRLRLAQPRAWFARVLVNLSRESRRRDAARTRRERQVAASESGGLAGSARGARAAPEGACTVATPDQLVARAELQERLAREVLALPQELREVVLLRHFEGLGPTEIAAELGLARSTAQDRLDRAHARLRGRLADVGHDPRLAQGLALLLVPLPAPTVAHHAALVITLMSLKQPLMLCAAALVLCVGWRSMAAAPSESSPSEVARKPEPEPEIEPDVAASAQRAGRADASAAGVPGGPAVAGLAVVGRATVVARVVDERGAPIKDASVQLVLTAEEAEALTVEPSPGVRIVDGPRGMTDVEGRVTLDVPAGRDLEFVGSATRISSSIWTSSSVGHGAVKALAAGASAAVELRVAVEPDIDVIVRVVAAESGLPLAGVGICSSMLPSSVRTIQMPSSGTRMTDPRTAKAYGPDAWTDTSGVAVLRARSWAPCVAFFIGSDRAPVAALLRDDGPRTGDEPAVTVVLERAACIEGQAQGAPPGARAQVVVKRQQVGRALVGDTSRTVLYGPREYVFEAPLDAAGRFVLAGLPPNTRLEPALFAAEGGARLIVEPTPLELSPGEVRSLTWELSPASVVVCTCVDERGRPIVGETVWLWPGSEGSVSGMSNRTVPEQTAATDAEGRVAFSLVRTGRWQVALAPPAPRMSPKRTADAVNRHASFLETVDVPESGGEQRVTLVGTSGLFLRGRVLGVDGSPVSATVWGGTEGYTLWTESLAKEGGAFELGPLPPGEYSIGAFDSFGGPNGAAPSAPLVLRSGADTLELRLRAAGRLSIEVLDRAGIQAQVGWTAQDGSAASSTTLTEEGAIESMPLVPGLYQATASLSDGRAAVLESVRVEAGQVTPVRLQPVPGGVLHVTHAGARGRVVVTVKGASGCLLGDGLRGGEGREFTLPPGVYSVRVSDPERPRGSASTERSELEVHTVTVTAGAATTLEVCQ
ncbi:MAG: RNA polymerase sigma factor [Planctomycetota bacterium]